ncbi:NIPSNAP family protein [Pseudaminobacter sp. 19-2017]|uniref:NIPSNAP family protein n=1 Tax=Pseudaminobacter soli (ex Zhang et al. 2022) TaxID=2831468 RepID=A0A942I4U4_9HYPH|nr:NIPSNAP family protein [Pseudaminobacter soli]MBS3652024.1 NIPSNAP family protein [Pseudaminobacter soli]
MTRLAPPLTIDSYYELRLYQMVPGRMPDFHRLMGEDVPPLFARNGIPAPLAFWEGYAGPLSPLYCYILHWRDLDDRMNAWERFYADPEWVAKMGANYGGQQRVERSHVFILRPSPVWERFREAGSQEPVGGVHELRFHDVLNQDPNLAHQSLADHDLPFLRARGARVLGVFATWFGTRMNQAVTLLAWPDAESCRQASFAHQIDPGLLAVRDEERRRYGRPLLRGTDIHILQPIGYGIARPNLAARG